MSQRKNEGIIMAKVKVNELALIYWCLQYGESVELITPISTRNEIKEIVNTMYNKYK